MDSREAHRIREPARARGDAERNARGPQQTAERSAAGPVLREKSGTYGTYLVVWVVKVICDRPALRDASMIRITD